MFLHVPIPKNAEVRKVENYRHAVEHCRQDYVAVLNEEVDGEFKGGRGGTSGGTSGLPRRVLARGPVYVLSEIIQRQKRRKMAWYWAFLVIKRPMMWWRDAC